VTITESSEPGPMTTEYMKRRQHISVGKRQMVECWGNQLGEIKNKLVPKLLSHTKVENNASNA
jgi:hypothetical protein